MEFTYQCREGCRIGPGSSLGGEYVGNRFSETPETKGALFSRDEGRGLAGWLRWRQTWRPLDSTIIEPDPPSIIA